jgi:hypothetical protein
MDLRELGWGGIMLIDLVQDRDQWRAPVNKVMNLRVPLNVGKFLSCCATGGFPRWAPIYGVSYFVSSVNSYYYCRYYYYTNIRSWRNSWPLHRDL